MIGAGSNRPEMTQIQKDKHHIFSPLWMLALNLQVCSFYLDTYQMKKSVRGHCGN